MAVDLIYKHQQKTYELMKKSLEKNGKAAYVYPTGCGKSFPALKYIEDNPDKTATIVVPSNFIKKQYQRNIKKYLENGKERLKSGNIRIVTYQSKLLKYKKGQEKFKEKRNQLIRKKEKIKLKKISDFAGLYIPKRDSDIYVFDEIHRMGAKEWEKAVDKMMAKNPKRKIIGMSATPERTNKRNMAYEKFGADVVYEMSLTEALSGEKEGEVLLKSPKYIRVVSQIKSELPKYKSQIDSIEDAERKEKYLKIYQRLNEIVSKSPDLQDVIAAGIKKVNGKYIVFCKDREDMFEKMENAHEIFAKVNSKINIDYILTKKSGTVDTQGKSKTENEKTLEKFETCENGDELNLLFCIDMLNEGVHLEGIDGEILFDLTKSPILYKQRIGRVLSSDKEAGEAVIIDAANNWLLQIDTYKEIETAIQAGNKKRDKDEKEWNLFKLLPEEVELLEILTEIGEETRYNQGNSLSKLLEIKKWCKEKYGDKPIEERWLPSSKAKDKEEKKLGDCYLRVKRYFNLLYDGKSLEEIEDDEHYQCMILLKELQEEYGLSIAMKNLIKIKKWCEEKYGDKPIEERCLPNAASKDKEEKKLGMAFSNYRNFRGARDEELEEFEKVYMYLKKEYGLSISMKNLIKVQKWCEENFGDKPREERRLPSSKSKDLKEREVGKMFHICCSKEMKVYEGKELEEIENEEHREIVGKIRFLRENYMSEEQRMRRERAVKSKLKKSVGKQIEHNEETRRELTEQTKEKRKDNEQDMEIEDK